MGARPSIRSAKSPSMCRIKRYAGRAPAARVSARGGPIRDPPRPGDTTVPSRAILDRLRGSLLRDRWDSLSGGGLRSADRGAGLEPFGEAQIPGRFERPQRTPSPPPGSESAPFPRQPIPHAAGTNPREFRTEGGDFRELPAPEGACLVEHLIRNQQVGGSSPPVGSSIPAWLRAFLRVPGRPGRRFDSNVTATRGDARPGPRPPGRGGGVGPRHRASTPPRGAPTGAAGRLARAVGGQLRRLVRRRVRGRGERVPDDGAQNRARHRPSGSLHP